MSDQIDFAEISKIIQKFSAEEKKKAQILKFFSKS